MDSKDLISFISGGIGGAIISFILNPFTIWVQEKTRNNKKARSEIRALVVDFRNDLKSKYINDNDFVFYHVPRILCALNTSELDNLTKCRLILRFERIIGKGWLDFFLTCPEEERIKEKIENLIEKHTNSEERSKLFEFDLNADEIRTIVKEIIDLLDTHPWIVRIFH